MNKLILEDPAIQVKKESSGALGNGFRCGFLGLLHMDVFRQRLLNEYNIDTITNFPNVLYKVRVQSTKKIIDIENVEDADDHYTEWYEPWVKANIITNNIYENDIKGASEDRRGKVLDYKQINDDQILLQYEYP